MLRAYCLESSLTVFLYCCVFLVDAYAKQYGVLIVVFGSTPPKHGKSDGYLLRDICFPKPECNIDTVPVYIMHWMGLSFDHLKRLPEFVTDIKSRVSELSAHYYALIYSDGMGQHLTFEVRYFSTCRRYSS